MPLVRPPAVAGIFYPADPAALRLEVCRLLEAVPAPADVLVPKAVIVPHAGYRYSAPVAATAYARVAPLGGMVRTVVLIGPAHHGPDVDLALSGTDAFVTPLGALRVDTGIVSRLRALPGARVLENVHAPEHCLEVQLPFIQVALGEVAIVPVLAGEHAELAVESVLDACWDGNSTLIVVSSDLSHYLSYAAAASRDRDTAAAVEALDADAIGARAACGRAAIRALLRVAARRGLSARTVDLRSSGDTGGERAAVVGYGAFVLGSPS